MILSPLLLNSNIIASTNSDAIESSHGTKLELTAFIESRFVYTGSNEVNLSVQVIELGSDIHQVTNLQLFLYIPIFFSSNSSIFNQSLTEESLPFYCTLNFDYHHSWKNVELKFLIKYSLDMKVGTDINETSEYIRYFLLVPHYNRWYGIYENSQFYGVLLSLFLVLFFTQYLRNKKRLGDSSHSKKTTCRIFLTSTIPFILIYSIFPLFIALSQI